MYELGADGLAPATVQGTILPLRAIFRHTVSVGDMIPNPATGLQLPAVRSHRDRIATPAEAEALLAALRDDHDRALWGTLLYAGLRLGEAQALRWKHADLARGLIRVERGWDAQDGEIEPKSRAAKRAIPIVPILRDLLLSHKLSADRDHGFVFGSADKPFTPRSVTDRAGYGLAQGRDRTDHASRGEARLRLDPDRFGAERNSGQCDHGAQHDRDHIRYVRAPV